MARNLPVRESLVEGLANNDGPARRRLRHGLGLNRRIRIVLTGCSSRAGKTEDN